MRADTLIRPLLVVPAVPAKDGGIKFILPKHDIVLEEEIAMNAWSILELCDGINTIDTICKQLCDQDDSFISGFLNDLNSLGIIIDSRKYYKHFHTISNNPMVYQSDITSRAILEHVNSTRLPVRNGREFKFHRNIKSKLFQLQELRNSCRSYSNEPLSIDEIGSVLDIGYSMARHAVPSAGSLYPMKIFVVVLKDQKDFPAGYYEYDNENNRIVLFNEKPDNQRIFYALNDIEMPFGASVAFIIVADADRQPYKYSNRGYRFMAIEAGEIAQNISLAAVEIGLATCELGGMVDDAISEELELDQCLTFLAILIGKESKIKRESIWLTTDELEKKLIYDDGSVAEVWLIDNTFANNYDKSYFQFLARSKDGQITSGISTNWADAKLKAIAEAHERQCSANVRWDKVAKASELDLCWLDPRTIAPLSDEQYSNLSYLQKFHENLEIEWVKGVSLNGQPVFAPIDLIFYPIENVGRKLVVDTCSSGFAAYTNYQEAVYRGLLEIVERDSLMRNWFEKSNPNIISTEMLPTHLRNRTEYWNKKGRDVFFSILVKEA